MGRTTFLPLPMGATFDCDTVNRFICGQSLYIDGAKAVPYDNGR